MATAHDGNGHGTDLLISIGLPGKPTQLERVTVREVIESGGQKILVLDGAWLAPRPSAPIQGFSPPSFARHLAPRPVPSDAGPAPLPPVIDPEAPTPVDRPVKASPPALERMPGPVTLIKGPVARASEREALLDQCHTLISRKPMSASALRVALGLKNNLAAKRLVYELIERGAAVTTSKGRKGRAGPGRRPFRYSIENSKR